MAAQFRQLQESDLEDVKRLHRFASYEGQPVFAQYGQDAAAVLYIQRAAVQATDGAFGVAALLPDPEEPSETDLVGAATGQLVMLEDTEYYKGAAGGAMELVLLTLVVRGDARRQGLGAALLAHLIHLGHQQQQQQQQQGGNISRVVADVSVSNKPAWGLFQRFGFTRGTATATTAEAVLNLQNTSCDKLLQASMTKLPRSTAAGSAPSLGSRVSNICERGMLRRFANFPRAGINSRANMTSNLGKRRQRSADMQDLDGPLAAADFQANKRFLGHRAQLTGNGEGCHERFSSNVEVPPGSEAVLPTPPAHSAQVSSQQQQQQQHPSACTDLVLYRPVQVDPSILAHTNPGLIGALCSATGSSDAYKALLPTALKGDTAQLKAVWHSLSASQRKNLRGMWAALREQGLNGSLPLLRLPSQDMPTAANGVCSDSSHGNGDVQPSCVIEEVADEPAPPPADSVAASSTGHQQLSPSSSSAGFLMPSGVSSLDAVHGAPPPLATAAIVVPPPPPAAAAVAAASWGPVAALGDSMAVDQDQPQLQQQQWVGLAPLQSAGSAEDMEM